tara:strand:- start:647 stop:934 length:288 start_codon:yes stop_codon:yes gene_type:complete
MRNEEAVLKRVFGDDFELNGSLPPPPKNHQPHSMRLVRSIDELRMSIQQDLLIRMVDGDNDLPIVLDGELIDDIVQGVGDRFTRFIKDEFDIPRG